MASTANNANKDASTPLAQKTNNNDSIKWLTVAVLIGLGVWGNVYFSQVLLLYRVLALLGLAVVTLFIAFKTEKGALFWNMLKEAKTEIRRVIWPTRQEVTQTTIIVVIAVFIMGLILWGLDSSLGWLVKKFIS